MVGPAAGAADVVLLHGFLGSGRNLGGLRRALVARLPEARIAALDLPGHGDAAPLAAEADLFTVAREVGTRVSPDGLARPRLWVGHSLGGRVLLAMAALAAEGGLAPPAQVVLLDIAPSPLGGLAGEMQQIFAAVMAAPPEVPTREALRDRFVADGAPRALADWATTNLRREGAAFRWRIDRPALAAFHRRDVAADLWPGAERLGGRCRLVAGGRSPFVSAADRARLVALGAGVEVAEAAGHFVHLEAEEAALAACLAAWAAAA